MTSATGNCPLRGPAQGEAKSRKRAKQNAITFIELMLVVVIIGALIGISVPNFRKTFNTLQLNNFSRELQAFVNYLRQRAVVESGTIRLNIDDEGKEYWASAKEGAGRLKTFRIPDEIRVETEQKEILFYPDGSIDEVTIKLFNPDSQDITLTTKGIFGGIKVQPRE